MLSSTRERTALVPRIADTQNASRPQHPTSVREKKEKNVERMELDVPSASVFLVEH